MKRMTCTFLVAATLATPAFAYAQSQSGLKATSETRADQLHRKAVSLHGERSRLEEAANLHKWSAKLREPGDPRAFEGFALAAHLFVYAGKLRQAGETMEQAAKFALDRGDVVNAARSYLEAAFIAERERKPNDVLKMARRAELLANSPALAGAERDAILTRIHRTIATATQASGGQPSKRK